MTFRKTAAVIAVMAMLTGCASHPRGFSPVMMSAPANQAAFETAFNVCSGEVAAGRRESFRSGRGGSAAGGMAVGGAAAFAVGASAAAGAGAGLGGGAMAATAGGIGLAAGLVLLAPLAIYGVSRMQRANKEREIQTAMSTCLSEEGYDIADWRVAREGTGGLASPTRATPVAEPSH